MIRTFCSITFFILAAAETIANAEAAEIKLLSPGALRTTMVELIPSFEKSSGHKVATDYAAAGILNDRIQKGEAADVVIVLQRQLEALLKQGRITKGSQTNIAKAGIGIAVRTGAPKPDIGSVEVFKRSLLAAQSISYADPAVGAGGRYLAGLMERLGIDAAELKPKTKVFPPGRALYEAFAQG